VLTKLVSANLKDVPEAPTALSVADPAGVAGLEA